MEEKKILCSRILFKDHRKPVLALVIEMDSDWLKVETRTAIKSYPAADIDSIIETDIPFEKNSTLENRKGDF